MASEALCLRGGNAVDNAAFTGLQREVVVDTDAHRLLIHDGETLGGFPANGTFGANGSFMLPATIEGGIETLPTGVSNYTSVLEIPGGSLVLAVSYIIKTPIGGSTQFELGVAGSLALFGSGLGVGGRRCGTSHFAASFRCCDRARIDLNSRGQLHRRPTALRHPLCDLWSAADLVAS